MTAPRSEFVGEVWSEAKPAEDPVLYGYARLDPQGAFEARSLTSFTLTYTAGRYGLDDSGSIKVVFRFTADGGDLQTGDPAAPNYVTAHTSSGVPLHLSFNSNGHQRPWYQALSVTVTKGYLREGERIEILFGDRSGGSPGMKLQSFCEGAFTFKVMADVCATGHYLPIVDSPTIAIVPGPPALWKAVSPTLRRPGERFFLGIKAEDLWGNPSDQVDQRLVLLADGPVEGLPESAVFAPGYRGLMIEGLSVGVEGIFTIAVHDESGGLLALSNPLVVRDGPVAGFWGDMHGQSGESVGVNTARDYFTFARDLAFLDATSHQANDFQINGAFWRLINDLCEEFHQDGRFLTLPGYEWSGNTGVGGDRNVYFREAGHAIRRSSHALIADRAEIDSDAPSARDLFAALQDEDCVVYAHIGGRPADVAYAHDARLETAMEIHSAWGSFEWLMDDCFRLGHRVGVVANSDGHKGRPGASYPGAHEFGAYGGLTCFLSDRLDRDAIFDCLRRRRHYATTGNRLFLDLKVTAEVPLARYDVDPKVRPGTPQPADSLGMGDIAECSADQAALTFEVRAGSAIERVDVLNAMARVTTVRAYQAADLGARIRVLWCGAARKGRGNKAPWRGRARFAGCRIRRVARINAWNHESHFEQEGDDSISFEAVTAGNLGGFDVWLDESPGARLEIATNHVSGSLDLADIGLEDSLLDAGGLDLAVRVFRLPEDLPADGIEASIQVPLAPDRDNPLWLRVTTEDGFQAWSSPVYLIPPET